MNGFETILPFLKPIEHLILDDSISEVMVNGADMRLHRTPRSARAGKRMSLGERALMVAVKNIARRLGDDISEAKPILDSRLPDGSRVAAVIPPCSLRGVTLTIRKFSTQHFGSRISSPQELSTSLLPIAWKTTYLHGRNILISGGTGTGKTTIVNALGRFIPEDERSC